MRAQVIRVAGADEAPEVRLLDARAHGLDDAGLRAAARTLTDAAAARCVSRSYRYPRALVAWHHDAVGIDIERVEPLDATFAASISTPEERIDWLAFADPDARLASLWASKEALAKALGDALSYDPRRLDAPMGWPDGRAGCWRASAVPVADGHVAWLCWRFPPR